MTTQEAIKNIIEKACTTTHQDIGSRPSSIERNNPAGSLWNIYNMLSVVTQTLGERVETCTDSGTLCILEECKAAASYEAVRIEALLLEMESQTATPS